MLVLSRQPGESVLGTVSSKDLRSLLAQAEASQEPIAFRMTLVSVKGNRVRFGLEFPKEFGLLREELQQKAA
ncbi:MAG: hypothetical protein Greene101449_887 [Candidatus Peregrinibacteria bacterium Greene1014_49]|nr:MAG: hypothetical protein Greene101449_887 [Candidatus Peregrinibacteria bacterium Greene1014_49]